MLDAGADHFCFAELSLQNEALAHDSQVILLLGNHELMNLQHDLRYINPQEHVRLGKWGDWPSEGNSSSSSRSSSSSLQSSGRLPSGPVDSRAKQQEAQEQQQQLREQQTQPDQTQQQQHQQGSDLIGPSLSDAEAYSEGIKRWSQLLQPRGVLRQELQRRQLLAVAGIGPCRSVFVHAGLTPGVLLELLTAVQEQGPGKQGDGKQQVERQVEAVNAAGQLVSVSCKLCAAGAREGAKQESLHSFEALGVYFD